MDKKKDLTVGSIPVNIIMFSIPIFLGYLFQNLYNSIDSAVVGKFVGKTALAAVTSCATISNIIVGFFTGLATGVTVLLSRYFGAKQYEDLHKAIHTSILFSIISGVFMAAVGSFISPFLLQAVKCPANVYEQSLLYLRLYMIGCIFTSIYNVSSSVLRSVGDSRSPFIYLVVSSVTNVILDLVFVAVLQMGVSGVGLATIVAQLLSCFLVYIRLTSTDDVYKLVVKDLSIDGKMLKELIDLGLPAALQTCLISFSNVFIQRYINVFGDDAMAGIGSAQKIDAFVTMPAQSIGLAITTFVSQNLGAEREDRVKEGIRVSLIMCLILTVALQVPLYAFAPACIKMFNSEPEVVKYGVGMMRTILPLYLFLAFNNVYAGVVRGYGYSKEVMVFSLMCMVVLRQIFLAIMMKAFNSIYIVYIGYPFAWGLTLLADYVFYYIKIKGRLKLIK